MSTAPSMRRLLVAGLLLCFATASTVAVDRELDLRKQNVGLILDTPFLHQDTYPIESEFTGPFGSERIVYEYNGQGLPSFIRFMDTESDTIYLDMQMRYRDDGHLEELIYLTYDQETQEVSFRDRFQFSSFNLTGPEIGLLETSDGATAEMRLTYDAFGRLVELEEDDAFGDGLYRIWRYIWADPADFPSLPLAFEAYFGLEDDIERYYFLYDANNVLRSMVGESFPVPEPSARADVREEYVYRFDSLGDLFK